MSTHTENNLHTPDRVKLTLPLATDFPVFDYALEPDLDCVFAAALKCVVCDEHGGIVVEMNLANGIERIDAAFAAERGIDPAAIIFRFDNTVLGPHKKLYAEFTGVNLGIVEVVFDFHYINTKL